MCMLHILYNVESDRFDIQCSRRICTKLQLRNDDGISTIANMLNCSSARLRPSYACKFVWKQRLNPVYVLQSQKRSCMQVSRIHSARSLLVSSRKSFVNQSGRI